HIEMPVRQGQAAGLREPCLTKWAVEEAFPAGAGERGDRLAIEIERPDLVRARHGDVAHPLREREVPWRAQWRRPSRAAAADRRALRSGARHCRDFPGLEADRPDRVILGIGYVGRRPGRRHSLWLLNR